jgi:hypothetical protein
LQTIANFLPSSFCHFIRDPTGKGVPAAQKVILQPMPVEMRSGSAGFVCVTALNIRRHFIRFINGFVTVYINRKFPACFHFSFCHFIQSRRDLAVFGTQNALSHFPPAAGG